MPRNMAESGFEGGFAVAEHPVSSGDSVGMLTLRLPGQSLEGEGVPGLELSAQCGRSKQGLFGFLGALLIDSEQGPSFGHEALSLLPRADPL
jgi:hypothetical protein